MATVHPVARMAAQSFLIRILRIAPLAAVAGLLLVALFLVAGVERETNQVSRASLAILVTTVIAMLVLLAAIGRRLAKLVQEVRAAAPGARLRMRLVAIFVALALPPVVIVYLFSVEFLDNTIDGWFDTGAEPALADAVELGRLYLDRRTREASERLVQIAAALPRNASEDELLDYLFNQLSLTGPTELTLLEPSGRVNLLAQLDPGRMLADLPSSFALNQAVRGDAWAAAEAAEAGLQIRVLRPIDNGADDGAGGGLILQGIFPVSQEFSDLATGVEQAYFRFENISFLRQRVQQSFILILSLVLGITALLAILLALNAARRVARPIRDLARATEQLRAGEFPETLDVTSKDELGFLVESFNSMARQLDRGQRQLEGQRHYLETLLGRLSAGVVAFDSHQRLTAANASASEILGLDLAASTGRDLASLAEAHSEFQPLFDAVRERIRDSASLWRREIKIELPDRTLALVCRGSTLPDANQPEQIGHVVVFDDVTMLDQAQRQAAWAELARRLAHEIKNPLTPIRLAAERLRLKLGDRLPEDDAELLTRATDTIIKQVDLMRDLVDAFGDYARPASERREPLDLRALIQGAVDLWSAGDSGVGFELALDHGQAQPLGDPGQFQQVLNNLVQNAREAHPNGTPTLTIASRATRGENGHWLELKITDDGPGFDPEMLPRVFEPYVSTKTRGTGLGLAIVARIIDHLGGQIQASNAPDTGGARITIRLPIRT